MAAKGRESLHNDKICVYDNTEYRASRLQRHEKATKIFFFFKAEEGGVGRREAEEGGGDFFCYV